MRREVVDDAGQLHEEGGAIGEAPFVCGVEDDTSLRRWLDVEGQGGGAVRVGQAEVLFDFPQEGPIAAPKGELLIEHCLCRPDRSAVVGERPASERHGRQPPIGPVQQTGVSQRRDTVPHIGLDARRFNSGDLRGVGHQALDRFAAHLQEPACDLIDDDDAVGHQIVNGCLRPERREDQALRSRQDFDFRA